MAKVVDLDRLERFHNNLKSNGLPLNNWQANKKYKVGYTVIQNGKFYRCKTEHISTTTFDTTKFDLVGGNSSGATISDWATGTTYSVGDLVIHDNNIYQCITAHTSTTFTADASNWNLIGSKGIDFYTVGESYNVNDIVIYNGNIYQCITAHTATSTFDATKWTEISASGGVDLPEWQANTQYKAGKYLVYEGTVYKVDNDFTSGTTFSDTNLTSYIAPIMEGATASTDGKAGMVIKPTTTDVDKFLKGDGTWGSAGGGISIWQANTAYNVNDVVIDSNLIWQCATAHTSTSIFDESKWVCISGGEISNGYEIVTLWEGIGNTLNQVLTLSDNYTNYEYILGTMADGAGIAFASNILYTASDYGMYIMGVLSSGGVKRAYLQFSSNQATILEATGLDFSKYISKVQGIRKAKPIVSSGMKYETLWEGEAGVINSGGTTTVSLNRPYSGYKKLGITVNYRDGSSYVTKYHEFDSKSITTTSRLFACFGYDNSNYCIESIRAIDSTTLSFLYNNAVVTKITGISEGVLIPTGVQAAKVTLWEGNAYTKNETLTLSDDYSNYDYIIVALEDSAGYVASSVLVDPKTQFSGYCQFYVGATEHTGIIEFSGNTATIHNAIGLSASWSFRKITGIKYIQPDSYSTEEKLIGTWIDGKPLYKKTYSLISPYISDGRVELAELPVGVNTGNVVAIDAIITSNSNGAFTPQWLNKTTDGYCIFIRPNRKIVCEVDIENKENKPLFVTIKYTKN